jgi:hypothetical protein
VNAVVPEARVGLIDRSVERSPCARRWCTTDARKIASVCADRRARELGGVPFAINPAKADDELRAQVDPAHQTGLYVNFNIVLNHVGDVFAYNGSSTALFSCVPLPDQWRDDKGLPAAAMDRRHHHPESTP